LFSIDQFQHVYDLQDLLGLAVTFLKLPFLLTTEISARNYVIRVASHLGSFCAMF